MLIEDLLIVILSACVIFFIIVPTCISRIKKAQQDPLAAAKHRLELAEKEYEIAKLNKKAFDLIDKSIEEEFQEKPNKKEDIKLNKKEDVEKTL